MRKPTRESKDQFAKLYLGGLTAANLAFLLVMALSLSVVLPLVMTVISQALVVYFYLCLKSYAEIPSGYNAMPPNPAQEMSVAMGAVMA